jgi:hypothetical protein
MNWSLSVSACLARSRTSAASAKILQWLAAILGGSPCDQRKKLRRLRILLASKTDNGIVSENSQFDCRSAEAPDCEPYASLVRHKEQIAAWLGGSALRFRARAGQKPGPSSKAQGVPKSPQIWPRLEGKPPQFVPRVED